MANDSHKFTPKASQVNQTNTTAVKRVKRVVKKPQQKPKRGNLMLSTVAIAILLSSTGLIMAFAWISLLFMFNPGQLSWLNKVLPAWAQIPLNQGEHPQTLKEIQASVGQQKQIAGEILPLNEDTKKSFLLPVFHQRANCQSDCQELVELRVYQLSDDLELQSQPEKYYYLATQLSVTGPDESFVVDGAADDSDVGTPLPLTQVKGFEGRTPSSGVWFYLRGQRQQGTGAIAYGQIIYYNPERTNLQQMLTWRSPNGQLPKWQQVTDDSTKELVIDQSLGLEPHLQVYQVKSVNLLFKPIQLAAISFNSPALEDSAYLNALVIARSGLWTPAFEWLKFIKKQRGGILPLAAQAQMDVIRLHSLITKTQADKSWASPGQQVLADLIDGRWGKALQVLEASPNNAQEIATLLKADDGRLWNRTVAALRVNSNRPQVQAWAALILAVQGGEEKANSWLNTQPQITKDSRADIQNLLARINSAVIKSQISSTHPSQIVGSVQPITQVTSNDWLQLDSTTELKLTDHQVWYQVEVNAFNDGKRWLNAPFENLNPPKIFPAKFFWETLGISSDPNIQIIVWLPNGEQHITTAIIKAVQLRNGVLRLLAAGDTTSESQNNNLQPRPLALTNAALEWVEPSPITLEQLYEKNPQELKAILPIIWHSLQQSSDIPSDAIPSFEQMQEKLGYWPVQAIDLTNDTKPEIVLSISEAAIASLNHSPSKSLGNNKYLSHPRTIIFSDNGKVIYTDFKTNSQQALTAIAKLSDAQSLALLVENANEYSLKRWSQKNQRFE